MDAADFRRIARQHAFVPLRAITALSLQLDRRSKDVLGCAFTQIARQRI